MHPSVASRRICPICGGLATGPNTTHRYFCENEPELCDVIFFKYDCKGNVLEVVREGIIPVDFRHKYRNPVSGVTVSIK